METRSVLFLEFETSMFLGSARATSESEEHARTSLCVDVKEQRGSCAFYQQVDVFLPNFLLCMSPRFVPPCSFFVSDLFGLYIPSETPHRGIETYSSDEPTSR